MPELAGFHWHPVLFTDESRFTPSTCDRRERVWRSRGERYAACNIVQDDRWEIPQETFRRLIRRMPRRCQVCIQARGGHTNYWVPFWVAAMKFQQNGLACCFIFSTLIFGVSLNSSLCRLIIFISIKRCGILSSLTHYPVHISIDIQDDIFPHWDLMWFQSVPLIFLNSVFIITY